MANQEQEKKGTFTSHRLSISKKYIYPASRAHMIHVGLLGCVLTAGYFAIDHLYLKNNFISSGPLSSNHANLESDCSSCHRPFSSVTSLKCSKCHEPSSKESAFFSFAAHYQYRSEDRDRAKSISSKFSHEEMPCSSCHQEHLGRDASITEVADSRCATCHDFGNFNKHPEFEFAEKNLPDDASLTFTHIPHVMGYVGGDDAEKTCSTCHSLKSNGKNFQEINFESHCDDCHGPHRRGDLTALQRPNSACGQCHVVSRTGVAPVKTSQRILHRAEFNHAAHTLVKECLGCHTKIPMSKDMQGLPEADLSSTQNIPTISNCQTCHRSNLNSNRCTTCHEFHPNASLRFNVSKL